jgi:hypothetical protein
MWTAILPNSGADPKLLTLLNVLEIASILRIVQGVMFKDNVLAERGHLGVASAQCPGRSAGVRGTH